MNILLLTDHLSRFQLIDSRLLVIVFLIFSYMMYSGSIQAQEYSVKLDQILMNDGSRLVGDVQEITDKLVIIHLASGSQVSLNSSDVKRIYQHVPSSEMNKDVEATFMDSHNRYFFGFDRGLTFGTADHYAWGFELAGYVKRKLNTRHLIGIRNTVKLISDLRNTSLYVNDINMEYNYLLYKPVKITPYLSVRFGTGFVFNNEYLNVRNTGFYPGGGIGIGLLKSIGKRSAFFYEISYNYQTYAYKADQFWVGEVIRRQVYDNIGIRIGYWF